MKLIAESGGTKTQWCGISGLVRTEIISTTGLNPNFVTEVEFAEVLSSEVLSVTGKEDISDVFFYGAGCSGPAMEEKVKSAIRTALPLASINVFSDLSGAARSLLGKNSGYLCMIGTGSNSGFYDGQKISRNVPPLGFILGDEGSGAYLGKRILADFLRGIMPAELAEDFRNQYGADKEDIVSHVYRGVFPSRYVGGFVRFLKKNLSHEYCSNLVKSSFEDFAARNLALYRVTEETDIAATGSVAWNFREILEEVFRNNCFRLRKITKEPIDGLIEFHVTE